VNKTIRTFIALPLNIQTQTIISEIINNLKKLDCNVKWIKPENVHLTLKFLGDISADKIKPIALSIENILEKTHSINVEIDSVGAFPNTRNPRIVWTGLKDIDERIKNLALSLEDELEKIGLERGARAFNPHITIGRVKYFKNIKILERGLETYKSFKKHTEIVNNIILYKSTLTNKGPIYEEIEKFPLV